MSRVGLEPTIPEFERAETVHALDRAPIVIGRWKYLEFGYCLGRNFCVRNSAYLLTYLLTYLPNDLTSAGYVRD
jgi:hypothetical protein